jgi:hypothetical protein
MACLAITGAMKSTSTAAMEVLLDDLARPVHCGGGENGTLQAADT